MARFVVLRHDLPDGSWHYDWMIERTDGEADPARPLLTFRVGVSPVAADGFTAERIGDHRAAYLDFEGEISGGRGSVTRTDAGECTVEAFGPGRIVIGLSGGRRLVGLSEGGSEWRFRAVGEGLASDAQSG